jgi:hypothetical protein
MCQWTNGPCHRSGSHPLLTTSQIPLCGTVLRCILRHYDVLSVRLIPQDLRALNLELFTSPSSLDFLRDHHCRLYPAFPAPHYRPEFASKPLCKTISYQYFCMPGAHRMSMFKSIHQVSRFKHRAQQVSRRHLSKPLMNKQQALLLTHPKKAKALSGVQ